MPRICGRMESTMKKEKVLKKVLNKDLDTDVVIVGTGVGGLFSALNLPGDRKIIMITKSDLESSDSLSGSGRNLCVKRRGRLRQLF